MPIVPIYRLYINHNGKNVWDKNMQPISDVQRYFFFNCMVLHDQLGYIAQVWLHNIIDNSSLLKAAHTRSIKLRNIIVNTLN